MLDKKIIALKKQAQLFMVKPASKPFYLLQKLEKLARAQKIYIRAAKNTYK
ncbi:MAG: hypothetical protein Q7T89_16875 [Anaerolineales bacterium]|nr:hypothetical protein [Anaerolineales bacterium]